MPVRPSDLAKSAIVRALVSDENGANFKVRDLVVLSHRDDVGSDGRWVLACISGTEHDEGEYEPVPWTSAGHPSTTFRKPCNAACHWLRILTAQEIDEVTGYMPGKAMRAIEARVRKCFHSTLGDLTVPITPGRVVARGQRDGKT